jgi:hypothetical protein
MPLTELLPLFWLLPVCDIVSQVHSVYELRLIPAYLLLGSRSCYEQTRHCGPFPESHIVHRLRVLGKSQMRNALADGICEVLLAK